MRAGGLRGTNRPAVWIAAALAFSVALAPSTGFAASATADVVSSRIPLYPDRPNERRVGALLYRGGLVLNSSDARFGGWSGIAVSAAGDEILAISDEAHWLRAHLSYDADGDLAGLDRPEISPMLGLDGKPMIGKDGDAEGLALERPNDLASAAIVSFERNVRIWRYDVSKDFSVPTTNVPVGDWSKALADNSQIEAITLIHPDTLLAIGEMKVRAGEDIPAGLEAYPGTPGRFATQKLSIVPHDPFAVTDVTTAPDGSLYMLERRFSLLGGVGAELRHIPAGEVHEGARLDGTVLADFSYQDANIDNMEGIALRRGPNGETFLYIISDDNYSVLQRTLLLMFEVRE